MPIDYDAIARAGGIGKGPPIGVVTAKRRAARQTKDERENDKVKARSGGQCEITIGRRSCTRRGFEVHHMISGTGQRARGASALAEHKQHACPECHSLITSKKVRRVGGEPPVWTHAYVRVRG